MPDAAVGAGDVEDDEHATSATAIAELRTERA
jgi:hypothetical protein